MMRVLLAAVLFTAMSAYVAETMKFNYKDAELVKVIEDYSKATKQKFIIDPQVRGRITIVNSDAVTKEEAFNQLSTAMAANGIAISNQDGVMYISQARNIQRNFIPVMTELPPMRPERMVTWVINLKHTNADEVNRQLRILTSKDGELVPYTPNNQILVTDWTPNLHRVAAIIKELDRPMTTPPNPVKKEATAGKRAAPSFRSTDGD